LRRRLDRIYRGQPRDNPVDRAFCETVHQFYIPRQLPEALLEGFAWDNAGRRYDTIEELTEYCARVAATVGLMMTLLMDQRDPVVLARAADLGVAMQLTNIARDVGEDAQLERLYLPQQWLREQGVDPESFLARPTFSAPIGAVVERLLDHANELYQRAETGIDALPRTCQTAIMAARLIYHDIGRVIAARGYDSITSRAHVSTARKLRLLISASSATRRRERELDRAAPPAGCEFLIESCTR
jgi:phytoene synthase